MIKKQSLTLEKKQLVLKKLVHQLACNNPTIRLRTINRIKIFLARISNDISDLELTQLWKGLHYAMWMTDKLLNQESLSDGISNLLFNFRQSRLVLRFFDAYLNLQVHEWLLIDQLRLDKFMMLMRIMFCKMFKHLNDDLWDVKSVGIFNNMIFKYLMLEEAPNSLLFFIVQIYLPELEKQQFTKEMVTSSIWMFAKAFSKTKKKYLAIEIKKHIFMNILLPDSKFQIENEKLCKFLLNLADKKSCRNQILVLGYVKLLKNSMIQMPKQKDKSERQSKVKKLLSKRARNDDVINDDCIEDAVNRWRKLDLKLTKKYLSKNKKRKRTDDNENLENIDDENDDIIEDVWINQEDDSNYKYDDDVNDDFFENDNQNDNFNNSDNDDYDVDKSIDFHDEMIVDDEVLDDKKILNSNKDLKTKNFKFKTKQNKNVLDDILHNNLPNNSVNDTLINVHMNCMSNVNATHSNTLIVKDNKFNLKASKKKKKLKKKKSLEFNSPNLKKRKLEITFEYDDESQQNNLSLTSSIKKKDLTNARKVKFSANNHSKEFHKILTPKFDPNLVPRKSALKATKLNKTF